MQKLLISIRGPREALNAANGGAHIIDVEYPASALGTPYPLNIHTVRNGLNKRGFRRIPLATNIGEKQYDRSTACQAALGVATAGVDIIKCGLAELPFEAAVYMGRNIIRTIRKFYPRKRIIPAVFIDDDMRRFFNPFKEGLKLTKKITGNGLLIDTFNKNFGKGLLDYCTFADIKRFASTCHKANKEAWIAGSITIDELPQLWNTGIDVVCIRQAACSQTGEGRFGAVTTRLVKELIATMP